MKTSFLVLFNFIFLFALSTIKSHAQYAQWGERFTRNMISDEVGLPAHFSVKNEENIKWKTSIGSHGYATPIVVDDKVLIGGNNAAVKDSLHQGDRGTLFCFNMEDGSLYWQLIIPRIPGDRHNDWPMIGVCSPPTVDGDKVYILTNRSEILCLDLNGMHDGNDGTFQGENWYVSPVDEFSYPIGINDADILWQFDMRLELGICPHDTPHASILIDGNNLYMNTCNGVDYKHLQSACLNAPSLIVLDKNTGKLLARDNENFASRIFHSSWSSPSLGVVNGKKLVFFAGGDGIVYAFVALSQRPKPDIQYLKKVWQFECDPTAPKENIHQYLKNREVSPSACLGMPVFYNNRIFLTVGGDIWWGKREAWLQCIDATLTGNITESGLIWSQPLERHSAATPAISNELIYVTDCGRNLHCFETETGKKVWSHKLKHESWSSAMVADNKVYVGSMGRDFWILEDSRIKNIIDSAYFDHPIASTPTVDDGVLYISTATSLFAIEEKK